MLAVGCDQRRGVERLVVRLDALLRAERDDVGMPEERSFDKLVALRDETLQVLIEGLWSMMAVAERERERERDEKRVRRDVSRARSCVLVMVARVYLL